MVDQKPKKILNFPIKYEWEKKISFNDKGNAAKTISNFCTILENSPKYMNLLKYNEMSDKVEYDGKPITTVDFDNIEKEIEEDYGLYDEKKFYSAIRLTAEKNRYNSIKNMLESLHWDGIKRADTIFSKYLGATENKYTAMCFRLIMFGAIERIYNPGAKFDYMLILKGGQGLGKSTLFNTICMPDDKSDPKIITSEYYQEDLKDIKNSFELTQGKWIVEIGELASLSKAEIDEVKNFITVRKETYRLPYDRVSKDYYRKFVIIGTTNNPTFLVDDTGNRRSIVLECAKNKSSLKHNVFEEGATYEIRQALAEVYQEYVDGKKFLTVPEEFEKYIEEINKTYIMDDGLDGIVEAYLENEDKCCVMQIWDEVLEPCKRWKYSRAMAARIIKIILKNSQWKRYSGSKDGTSTILRTQLDNYGNVVNKKYEKQATFEKILNQNVEKEQIVNTDYINETTKENFNDEELIMKVGEEKKDNEI